MTQPDSSPTAPQFHYCSNFWRIVLVETNRSFNGLNVRLKYGNVLGQKWVPPPPPSLQRMYTPVLAVGKVSPPLESLE